MGDIIFLILECVIVPIRVCMEIVRYIRNPCDYKNQSERNYILFTEVIGVLRLVDYNNEGRDGYLTRQEIQELLNQREEIQFHKIEGVSVKSLWAMSERGWLAMRTSKEMFFTNIEGKQIFYAEWRLSPEVKRNPPRKKTVKNAIEQNIPNPEPLAL